MFAYCGNNPVVFVDSSGQFPTSLFFRLGQRIGKWLCKLAVGQDDNEVLSLGEKITQTFKSLVYNLELSAGVGMGLYGETEILDAIGLGAGVYATNLTTCYENGEWMFGNEAYVGISATFLWNEIGAAESVFRPEGGEWEGDHWVLYNDTETSITIFSASAYLFAGGSVRIGFDLNTFLWDVSNIWGVGLYAKR